MVAWFFKRMIYLNCDAIQFRRANANSGLDCQLSPQWHPPCRQKSTPAIAGAICHTLIKSFVTVQGFYAVLDELQARDKVWGMALDNIPHRSLIPNIHSRDTRCHLLVVRASMC
jgi:hypothetical protein